LPLLHTPIKFNFSVWNIPSHVSTLGLRNLSIVQRPFTDSLGLCQIFLKDSSPTPGIVLSLVNGAFFGTYILLEGQIIYQVSVDASVSNEERRAVIVELG
jgi:hypothetical protein